MVGGDGSPVGCVFPSRPARPGRDDHRTARTAATRLSYPTPTVPDEDRTPGRNREDGAGQVYVRRRTTGRGERPDGHPVNLPQKERGELRLSWVGNTYLNPKISPNTYRPTVPLHGRSLQEVLCTHVFATYTLCVLVLPSHTTCHRRDRLSGTTRTK